ncbi:hypothetical protein KY348_05905, partial [Candidatus Woesearchaeota archaeon]|nr:hypothetical protein [Candidatus Woesearchaeota archaeon]
MRVTKLLALVMIYLVISLIFLSAFVFATIYKAEAYGQDEAPGTIRADDALNIRTESVRPCTVSADFTNNSYEAMSCGSGTPVVCSYTYSFTNATGMMSAVVKEDDSGLTENLEVYVDNLAPRISSLACTSLGTKARANYAVNDEGNEYYLNKCSGIEKVELYLDNQLVNTTNHSVGECSVSDMITGAIPNYIGKVNTSIRVYDYVGLIANKTGNPVFIDSVPPIISSSANVYKAGTKEAITKVSTTSSKVMLVDIQVVVEDNALTLTNSVYGNFSELDKTKSTDQSNIGAACIRKGWEQTYNCTFKNIKLSPNTSNPGIIITATDQVGNTVQQSMGLSFTVVNEAGTVTRLGPVEDKCYQEKCYLSSGVNEITAHISTSSSFNDSDIRIQGVQAECKYNTTQSAWICKADVSGAKGVLSLEGFDDLGNAIQAESELEIILDPTPPKRIGEINVSPICPVSGESLKIEINITEAQSPEVIIKAVTLSISDDNETSARCAETETSGLWECVLTISNLKNKGINTNLNVIVEDFAGNQLIEKVAVSICIEVDEVPDLIEEIKTIGKLPKIDRRVASKITVKVPIGLEIVKKYNDVEILDRSSVDCSDTKGRAGNAYMINDDSLKPILVIPLKYNKEWDEDNKAKINCTQEFTIKHGNKIYRGDEEEYISAELEVYNQALGMPSETVQKEMDQIKKDLRDIEKSIEKRDKILKYVKTICNLQEKVTQINRGLQLAKQAAYLILAGVAALPFPGAYNTANRIWKGINSLFSFYDTNIARAIFPEGYITGFKGGSKEEIIGSALKLLCALYTCKTYDIGFWASIGVEAFSMKAWSEKEKKEEVKEVEKEVWELPSGQLVDVPIKNPLISVDVSPASSPSKLEKPTLHIFTYDVKQSIRKGFYALENEILYDGVIRNNWIVNPYKNADVDGLCLPAKQFNDRKERQIKCMHLACLIKATENGLPLEGCYSKLELDEC